ncbi:MAG: carbohydrate ABC transporter substrate-binding protein [Spirochaetaceae bacterium]|nr:carbohydrate ABC transporter substrate-binding protein [Spirochaetaceae bacterium]
MKSSLRRAFGIAAIVLFALPAILSAQSGEIVLKWPCIWVGKDSKAPAIAEIVSAFNTANAGKIKVEIEPQPDYNAYEQKVRTSLAAGVAPGDIFTIKLNATTKEYYESKLIMDLAKDLSGTWKASFDPGAVAQSTIGGKLKTLPFETAVLPLWYNMDMMKKAGVEKIPATMPELWTTLDKLKASGVFPTSQMSGDVNAWTSMIWFSHFAVSFGGAKVWEKPFTDKAFLESAKLLQRLFKDYTTPDAVGAGAGVSGGHFLAGRTAIFSNGPWYAGRADLRATPFFPSVTIAEMPPAGPNKGIMISRLQANVAAGETKDKARRAAIVSFLKYLTSTDNVAKLAQSSGAMFAVKTSYVPTDALQKQFYDIAARSKTTSNDLEAALGAEATREFAQQLGALALGQITPEQFVALVEKKIDR